MGHDMKTTKIKKIKAAQIALARAEQVKTVQQHIDFWTGWDLDVNPAQATRDFIAVTLETIKELKAGSVAPAITSGHLANNGGIRGHSAGDIYPWRLMAQGTMADLRYWVINPAGEKVAKQRKAREAMAVARVLKARADGTAACIAGLIS